MHWKSIYQIATVLLCFITSILAIRRGLILKSWSKMEGTVLGPITHLNKSAVNVEFINRAGLKRTFISDVLYGHYFKANREDFNQVEIGTSMYLWIGLTLLQATLLIAYNLYRIKI